MENTLSPFELERINERMVLVTSRGSMTISVDPAAAGRVPLGVVFRNQGDVMSTLGEHTAFKYLMEVWHALPTLVLEGHTITIQLAAGVHRPDPNAISIVDQYGTQAVFFLAGKLLLGEVSIVGASPDEWTDVGYGTLTVDSSVGGTNPYVDVSTSHPNVFGADDLKGLRAWDANGVAYSIHDNTGDRLYLVEAPSSPGTITVGRQGTILRNSLDDETKVSSGYDEMVLVKMPQGRLYIQNVQIDDWGAARTYAQEGNADVVLTACGIDHQMQEDMGVTYSQNTVSMAIYGGTCTAYGCNLRGIQTDNRLRAMDAFNPDTTHSIMQCVLYNYPGGVTFDYGSQCAIINSVFDTLGRVSVDYPSIALYQCGSAYYQSLGGFGKTCEIRNSPGIGMRLLTTTLIAPSSSVMIFASITGPCVYVGSQVIVDKGWSTAAWVDGGSNADVGWEFVGLRSIANLDAGTDITGSNGDIRVDGSTIITYAQAEATYEDNGQNLIRKAT